jgi:hypothetical protein
LSFVKVSEQTARKHGKRLVNAKVWAMLSGGELLRKTTGFGAFLKELF